MNGALKRACIVAILFSVSALAGCTGSGKSLPQPSSAHVAGYWPPVPW